MHKLGTQGDDSRSRKGLRKGRGMTLRSTTALSALAVVMMVGSSLATFGSTAGASASSQAQAAKSLAAAEKIPTVIPVTTPVKATPPKGKTLVWLECQISQCAAIQSTMATATKAIGWNLKTIDYDESNPATLVTAMNQALQYHPVGVAFSALPYAVWKSEVPIYKKAGVLLLPALVGPVPLSKTVPVNVGPPPNGVLEGKISGDFTSLNTKGNGNVLVVSAPEIAILQSVTAGYTAELHSVCQGCSITNLQVTVSQLDAGQVNGLIVAALQKNPDITQVVASAAILIDGLKSALASAGLVNKVSIVTGGCDATCGSDILSGAEPFGTSQVTGYAGYLVTDASIRSVEGMSNTNPSNGKIPILVLTQKIMQKNNIKPALAYPYPLTTLQQFEKIWKVKS
jgi:ribose transport system substrate-binding protein